MITKICKICLVCKDINQFRLDRKYISNICLDCEKKKKKQYREDNKEAINKKKAEYRQNNKEKIKKQRKEFYKNNKEQIKNNSKEYYKNNKEQIKEYKKEYNEKNVDQIKEYNKEYRKNNKEKIKNNSKKYYNNNKEEITEYQKKYQKQRRKIDPIYTLRKNFSSLFSQNIKNIGLSKKGNSCFDVLNYTFEQLIKNIESKFEPWMNWNNYGKYDPKTWDDNDPRTWRWNLDHPIPQSDLPYTSFEDENFKKCWSLDNLRPYSAKQNAIDGATRIRHKKKE